MHWFSSESQSDLYIESLMKEWETTLISPNCHTAMSVRSTRSEITSLSATKHVEEQSVLICTCI